MSPRAGRGTCPRTLPARSSIALIEVDETLTEGTKRFIDRHLDHRASTASAFRAARCRYRPQEVGLKELSVPGGGEIALSIASLSDAELIRVVQHEDLDDGMTQFVEVEIARRKKEGAPNNPGP